MAELDWSSKRLLVVDGDTAFRAWAKQVFESIPVGAVRVAASGGEALWLLQDFPADLVVLDFGLPGADGIEIARRLRDRTRSPAPDILIVLTAKQVGSDALRSACMVGIEGFLRKPTDAEGLVKRVGAALADPQRFVVQGRYVGPPGAAPAARSGDGGDAPAPVKVGAGPRILSGEDLKRKHAEGLRRVDPKRIAAADLEHRQVTVGAMPAAIPAFKAPDLSGLETGKAGGNGAGGFELRPSSPAGDWKKRLAHSSDAWKEALGPNGTPRPRHLRPSTIDVARLLDEHGAWLRTAGRDGRRADVEKADLQGADLPGADLSSANLRGAVLADANLAGASFQGADLRHADLSCAQAMEAVLGVAKLRHVNLWRANLVGANLRGADLAGANLREAVLEDADLTGTNLLGADIRGTDLSRVKGLQQAQIAKVVADAKTRLPLGVRRPGAEDLTG